MGRPKQYVVHLSEGERSQLLELIKKGEAKARQITRAHGLLLSAAPCAS